MKPLTTNGQAQNANMMDLLEDDSGNITQPDRPAMLPNKIYSNKDHLKNPISSPIGTAMDLDDDDTRQSVRQDPENGANRFDRRASMHNHDRNLNLVNHDPRLIKSHHPRYAAYREYTHFDERYTAQSASSTRYYDRGNTRVDHYSPSPPRRRERSPEALKWKNRGELFEKMADVHVKEEREDRRDRGGYRGGNKRRRDGE